MPSEHFPPTCAGLRNGDEIDIGAAAGVGGVDRVKDIKALSINKQAGPGGGCVHENIGAGAGVGSAGAIGAREDDVDEAGGLGGGIEGGTEGQLEGGVIEGDVSGGHVELIGIRGTGDAPRRMENMVPLLSAEVPWTLRTPGRVGLRRADAQASGARWRRLCTAPVLPPLPESSPLTMTEAPWLMVVSTSRSAPEATETWAVPSRPVPALPLTMRLPLETVVLPT